MDITMRPNGKSALPDSQRIEFLAFLVLAASLRGLARTNKTPIQIVLPFSHAQPHPPTIKIKSHPSIPPDRRALWPLEHSTPCPVPTRSFCKRREDCPGLAERAGPVRSTNPTSRLRLISGAAASKRGGGEGVSIG